jgi:hypothetical protein
MKDNFKYRFDESTGIMYKHYYGLITIEDISSSWDYAMANGLIPNETKGFILDYRKASFDINIREHGQIADYYKNHLDIFRDKKIAIITQTSKDVLIPTLVESRDEGYQSRPFYTVESAINWVLDLY